MKKNTETFQPDSYYHIYNRGVNGTRIFTKTGNADYFLEKYVKYIEPIALTYAYVLMGNHFHFFIKTKSEEEIKTFYSIANARRVSNAVNAAGVKENIKSDREASHIISQQFANLFNAYAQAINKQDKRTGGLFEEPFRRVMIDSMDYATYMVYYIHHNPKKHGFLDDFRIYAHSSYAAFLHNEPTFIQRKEVLSWFGGLEPFLVYHGAKQDFDVHWYDKNWVEI